jgi:CubicO group peptidase (beta-lactamase class C family)
VGLSVIAGAACGGQGGPAEDRVGTTREALNDVSNVTLQVSDVSATISFSTASSEATTVIVTAGSQQAILSDAAATTHSLAFFELLWPSTTYQFSIYTGSGTPTTGSFNTAPPKGPVGQPFGSCSANANYAFNTRTGMVTCTYAISQLPAGGNAQPLCPANAQAPVQVGFSWTPSTQNAGYKCPTGSVLTTGATNKCIFGDFDPIPSWENQQALGNCTASASQVGYVYTPHDAVIGPIAQTYFAKYGAGVGSGTATLPLQSTAGWSVGVRRGQVEDYYSYGFASLPGPFPSSQTSQPIPAGAVPIDRTSIFYLASVAKPFTGALLARLATDPSVASLNIHVGDTVDSIAPAGYQAAAGDIRAHVTLFDLGAFTGAFDDGAGGFFGGLLLGPTGMWNYYQTEGLLVAPGQSSPVLGQYLFYSNASIVMLGRAIEQKVLGPGVVPAPSNMGSSWEGLLRSYITGPLGLNDTQTLYPELASEDASYAANPYEYVFTSDQQSRVAVPYQCTGTLTSGTLSCSPVCATGVTCEGKTVNEYSPPRQGSGADAIYSPAGGLWSSGADMMVWLRMNMGYASANASWARPQMLQAMRPQATSNGLGWGDPPDFAQPGPITTWPDGSVGTSCSPLIQKDGTVKFPDNTAMLQASIGYQPALNVGAFALSNDGQNDPQGMVEHIMHDVAASSPSTVYGPPQPSCTATYACQPYVYQGAATISCPQGLNNLTLQRQQSGTFQTVNANTTQTTNAFMEYYDPLPGTKIVYQVTAADSTGTTVTAPMTVTALDCSCHPSTQCGGGYQCGTLPDGCGGTTSCGSCTDPNYPVCSSNMCCPTGQQWNSLTNQCSTVVKTCPRGMSDCGGYCCRCSGTSCG